MYSRYERSTLMNKIKMSMVSFALVAVIGSGAFAAGNEFAPLDFSNPTYTSSNSSTVVARTAATTTTSATSKQPSTPKFGELTKTVPAVNVDLVGNKKMQSAITELDNAQVEVRNELLDYKTKYSEIDAKYTSIKAERANMAKQVRDTEKRIKQLDKAKEKIRKNMI